MEPSSEDQITIKQRHGCVTAWIVFMIIVNSITAIVNLFASNLIAENLPVKVSTPMIILLGVLGMTNAVFAYMLLRWKKWGFYGIVVMSALTLIINLSIGLGIGQSLLGLLGVVLLYGILQMKKDNVTAWDNLE